jgi:hypothetical protein
VAQFGTERIFLPGLWMGSSLLHASRSLERGRASRRQLRSRRFELPPFHALVIMACMRIVLALLLVASSAAAEPPAAASVATTPISATSAAGSFSFVWSAPSGCPTQTEVLGRAERLVGHTLTRASGAQPVELLATVQAASSSAWQLTVSSGSHSDANRSVSASSCEELADAMALLIALSVDPDAAARKGAAPAPTGQASFADIPASPPVAPLRAPDAPLISPPAPKTPAPVPARAASPSHEHPARSAARTRLTLGALAALWADRLPGAAPGGVLRAALSQSALAVDAQLGWFPAEHVARQGLGADLSLATLSSSLGYALFDGLLTPYAGLELDRMHGVGTGVRSSASGTIWLLGLDAGLRLGFPSRSLVRLLVDTHLSVVPEQARFHIDPSTELFRVPSAGVQFALGAEIRIW